MLYDFNNSKVLYDWGDMRRVAGPNAEEPLQPGDTVYVTIFHNKFLLDDYLCRNKINNVTVIFIGGYYEP